MPRALTLAVALACAASALAFAPVTAAPAADASRALPNGTATYAASRGVRERTGARRTFSAGDGRRAARLAASAPFPSRLRTANGRIVDGAGRSVLLRGFNVIPVWSDHPGRTWGADHYERIAARGFNVVRFVLHWSVFEPRRGRFDRTHLATLDTAIAHARAAGLYVVLVPVTMYKGDTFTPGWARGGDPLRPVERHAAGYVAALGARYRDESAVAAYDLVNEPPTWPPDQNRILRMYRSLAQALRRQDASRMVMVEPSFGASSMRGAADLRLLASIRNVVFSYHDYYLGGAGDGYRPQGDAETSWNGPAVQTLDAGVRYSGGRAGEFESHLLHNLRRMRSVGVPVWVGEWGIDPTVPGARRYIREKLALFAKHRVGHAWWLYGVDGPFAPLDASGRFRPFVALLT